MRFWLLLLVATFSASLASAQQSYLFKVGPYAVAPEEFQYVYEKNNFDNADLYTRADIEEYLDLYVNFKLKIAEAHTLGYNTLSAFRNEYDHYKEQLIQPYRVAGTVAEKLAIEAYKRMQEEIDASHILVQIPKDATPADTTRAYEKIKHLRAEALSGKDFGSLASTYSEDPSAAQNKGRLGYFTGFQMVYPFENAAYHTAVGQVSDIVRSQFGYHIIQVHDRRPAQGEVQVSHIMIRPQPQDSLSAQAKIFEIYDQLKGGADWTALCARFSDDPRTKNSGGTLPYFARNQIDPAFAEMAFALQNPGDISDPFRTAYGWHIVKLEGKKPLESFEQLKDHIESQISRDGRLATSKELLLDSLKNAYAYQIVESGMSLVRATLDSNRWSGSSAWQYEDGLIEHAPLFILAGDTTYTTDFLRFLQQNNRPARGQKHEDLLNARLQDMVEEKILEQEEKMLSRAHPELAMLLREYYEGLLLFEIMDDKIWSKAVTDSVGLARYHQEHLAYYQWGPRIDAVVLDAATADVLEEARAMLHQDRYKLLQLSLPVLPHTTSAVDSLLALAGQVGEAEVEISITNASRALGDELKQMLVAGGIPEDKIRLIDNANVKDSVLLALFSRSKKSLELQFNAESALNLSVRSGVFERSDLAFADQLDWKTGYSAAQKNGRFFGVQVYDTLPPGPKDLNEVKGAVISDYQDYLEQKWIDELKAKYQIDYNKKEHKKLYRHYDKKRTAAGR